MDVMSEGCSGAPRIWQRGEGHKRGRWVNLQLPTKFYGFHMKNTHFSTLFIKIGHSVSAVTRDNAKIFSQFTSKSRSLAKISERRLYPSLVWEITDWKLGFSTLLQAKGGGGMAPCPPCERIWLNAPFFSFAPIQCPHCQFQHESERGAK